MNHLDRILRYAIIAVGAAAEVLIIAWAFHYFRSQFVWIEGLLRLLGGIICIYVVNNSRHLSMDILWVMIILLFPIPGTLVYFLLGAGLVRSKTARSLYTASIEQSYYLEQDKRILDEMYGKMPALKGDFRYISESAGYPFYRNAGFDYYSPCEKGFPVMLEELEKAQEFIFLEYFIIGKGQMWNQIHEILKRKAEAGLDVRIMYDDFGSMKTLSPKFSRELESEGIRCIRFNKINPVIGAVMNHRDHRKIMVIDGKVAFSGGMNLADEYINEKNPYGHWKDNCVRIKGEAVWSYTVMFLSSWNALRKTDDDFKVFRREADPVNSDGYIAPYGGHPLSRKTTVGESIYINMINSATDYLYISTPYLIIDTELENALILAAQKGVEIIILTPGIPDKKMIWWITRSFYGNLMDAGIKIYEYTPGFVHAKTFVSDDRAATVGTFNLDYRSLYLHFENGAYLCDSDTVAVIRDDFRETVSVSRRMKKEDIRHGLLKKMIIGITKLFVSQM